MPLKTLFLNPPSFENFDGGAGSRWPATREVESFWYPVWLAYPTGMLEGARLLDGPSHHVSGEETIKIAKDYRQAREGHGKPPKCTTPLRAAVGIRLLGFWAAPAQRRSPTRRHRDISGVGGDRVRAIRVVQPTERRSTSAGAVGRARIVDRVHGYRVLGVLRPHR